MIETDDAHNPTTTPLADTVVDNTAPATASVNVSGCGNRVLRHERDPHRLRRRLGFRDRRDGLSRSRRGATGFTTVATQTSGFSLNWNSTTVPDARPTSASRSRQRANGRPTRP